MEQQAEVLAEQSDVLVPERLVCSGCNKPIEERQPYVGTAGAEGVAHHSCWLGGPGVQQFFTNLDFLLRVLAAGIKEFRNGYPTDNLAELLRKRLATAKHELGLTKRAALAYGKWAGSKTAVPR